MQGISLKQFKKTTKELTSEISGIEKKLNALEDATGKSKLRPLPDELEYSTEVALRHLKEQKQILERQLVKEGH